jgi:amidase
MLARVSHSARPGIDLKQAHDTFFRLLRAATTRSLTDAAFARHLDAARTGRPDDDAYPAVMAKGNTLYHREWLYLNETRHDMRLKWAEFFRDWDVLLCPAAATAAFPHNQQGERWERMVIVNGKPQPSTTQMFWAGYSGMCYLPSTVAPAGLTAEGLPVGVQIVGPQYGDLTCLAFAQLLEREYGPSWRRRGTSEEPAGSRESIPILIGDEPQHVIPGPHSGTRNPEIDSEKALDSGFCRAAPE